MQIEKAHPCELIYNIGANNKIYGDIDGVCRITGKQSKGIMFKDWVRDTFTNHDSLKPGTIISNQALFCFDESSEIVMRNANKDKPQRFRTYSHIITSDNKWFCLTKSDKKLIYDLIIKGAKLVCLTDSGQKHMLFKHKIGFWQLDDSFVFPNVDKFIFLHSKMCELLELGFSQTEIITGNYIQYRIVKAGLAEWKNIEDIIKIDRGTAFFNFTSWLLFTINK